MTTTKDFNDALASFLVALQDRENRYMKANFPNLTPHVFTISLGGRRYIRIVKSDGTGRSVHCFVERATGNIYKAAGWKAPTLNHVRGNIFNENPVEGTNVYGANLCGNRDGMNDHGV